MEEVKKDKTWIKNYVLMLIQEVKDVPEKKRQSREFMTRIAMKHMTFNKTFPSLLRMIVDSGSEFDMATFNIMLQRMDNVQKGKEEVEKVDKELGQEYYDKYVAPVIDE